MLELTRNFVSQYPVVAVARAFSSFTVSYRYASFGEVLVHLTKTNLLKDEMARKF